MSFTKRERTFTPWLRHSAAAVALGVMLGFAGPYGTNPRLERPVRYAFWIGLTLFGYLCVLAATAIVRATPALARLPNGARLGLAAIISAVPQTLATAWVFSLVQPGRITTVDQLPLLFAAVLAVQVAIALVAGAVTPARAEISSPAQTVEARPAFLDRLPPHLDGDVVALEAQDHYLKVYTSSGSALVLSRLSDAIAQLGGIDGLQVHRGWWVAADAVAGVENSGGRTLVRMNNGILVPVSRTYLQSVRARVWPQC